MAPRVWGDGAVMRCEPPTITERLNGVAEELLSKATSRPEGFVAKPRLTVLGWSTTLLVSVRPEESVAVRMSSR